MQISENHLPKQEITLIYGYDYVPKKKVMRLSTILTFSILFLSLTISAQSVEQVKTAFASGNVTLLSGYFGEEVEISMNRKQDVLSGEEAKTEMKSFFAKHPPVSFSNVHKGASGKNGTGYFTGDLQTSKGVFRVFVYFEKADQNMWIKEIRIDQM